MACQSCALIAARDEGAAPLWDAILRTEFWDVVHAFNTSLLGWIVLVSRTHEEAIETLSTEAALELGRLIRDVSIALTDALGCAKTYVMQFAESPDHGHVHFHVVPRMADIPAAHKGASVMAYLGVPDHERVPDAEMNALAEYLRERLLAPAD